MKKDDKSSSKKSVRARTKYYIIDNYKALFQEKQKRNEFIEKHKFEPSESSLWKASTRGISLFWLATGLLGGVVCCIYALGLGGGFIITDYTYIEDIIVLIFGLIFCGITAICFFFWTAYAIQAIFPKANHIMKYVDDYDIDYMILEKEFKESREIGTNVYWGKEYLFVKNGAGMNVIKIADIDSIYNSRYTFVIESKVKYVDTLNGTEEERIDSVTKYEFASTSFLALKGQWKQYKTTRNLKAKGIL